MSIMAAKGGASSSTFLAAVGVGLAVGGYFYLTTASNKSSNRGVAAVQSWLSEEGRAVLVAVVDALVPSEDDATPERIQKELVAILGEKAASLPVFSCFFSAPNKQHLLRGAVEAGIPALIEAALGQFALKKDRDELGLALKLLSTSVGNLALTGNFKPFHHLSLPLRVRALAGLRDSIVLQKRSLYHALKRLTGFFLMAHVGKETSASNPSWSAIKYAPTTTIHPPPPSATLPPPPPSSSAPPLFDLPISEDGVIEADVVIIGSGAGGGMAAYQLARAGYVVVVLDKGGYFTASEHFSQWREFDAMRNLYDRAGLVTTSDSNIVILAGSTVGGGTTVNWSASFNTPQHVLRDWNDSVGGGMFAPGGEFEKALEETHRLLHVNTDNSFNEGPCHVRASTSSSSPPPPPPPSSSSSSSSSSPSFVVNKNNQLLHAAATRCGLSPEKIPRNVTGCTDCGSCCFGCSSRSKQSTWELMLKTISGTDPSHNGGRKQRLLHVLPDCDVGRVLFDESAGRRRAVGVEALQTTYTTDEKFVRVASSRRVLTVKAKVVCCSAGALHTPAVLLRSGLRNSKIGRHLCLHPVLACAGVAAPSTLRGDGTTGLSRGVGMGVVVGRKPGEQEALGVASTARLDDKSEHGVVLQTPPVHPGLMGIALPWRSGLAFKLCALLYPQLALFIGISRDRSSESNRVVIDAQGNSVVHYEVTAADVPMLMAGLKAQIRLMFESGCDVLFPMHETVSWFVRDQAQSPEEQRQSLEEYIKHVEGSGFVKLKNLCFSAHQMGSCRRAASPARGPVAPSGEVWETDNLFVADASLLPTSLGVNPMITIESLAIVVSKNIAARLLEMGATPSPQDYELDW
jgi:choline dehydrogenase-like flavoprotein